MFADTASQAVHVDIEVFSKERKVAMKWKFKEDHCRVKINYAES